MTAVGIIFSNIHDKYVGELTRVRTMASVPFGCKYRLIDFTLSNFVNSKITTVGVVTKYNYQSLMDHIGNGKDWDLSRKNGGIIILPPYSGAENATLYKTRLDALKGILNFISRCDEEYVVLSDSDKIINIDYAKVIDFHEKNAADITVVYKKQKLTKDNAAQNIVYDIEFGRIKKVYMYPKTGLQNVCQNIFVLKRENLLTLISEAISNNNSSFHGDILGANVNILNIRAYEFQGYTATIENLAGYFKHSMELLNKQNRDAIFKGEAGPIYTKVRDSAPTKYSNHAKVENSLIADGCTIEGTVINSLIFRGVKVSKGSVVKNSILMQDTQVGDNASLNFVITDKDCSIKDRRILAGCAELPYFIAKGVKV